MRTKLGTAVFFYNGACLFSAGTVLFSASTVMAQQSVMQQCGAQWQAAKAANTTNGQSWPQFLAECRKTVAATPAATTSPAAVAPVAAASAVATTPVPATAPAKPVPPAAATPAGAAPAAIAPSSTVPTSNGRAQEQSRIKTCGEQWKVYKASGQVQPGESWPKYWSDCNKRLKAQGQ